MRGRLLLVAQIALALIVLAFAGVAIVRQWEDVRQAAFYFRPRWGLIAVSALPVLLAYLLLIQTWRTLMRSWGAPLRLVDAAHIWLVSSLGRYVPGKVWQLGAMGIMAQRRGVPPAIALGSALIATLLMLLTGFAVVFATGARVLELAGAPTVSVRLGVVLLAALAAFLLLTPSTLPRLATTVARATGRPVLLSAPPARAVWIAAAGALTAWLLFGVAFRIFSAGVLGPISGATVGYVAVFVGSYLLGFLVVLAPGGILVREAAIVASLTGLGLATLPEATLLALTSRLWLTVLEVGPGAVLLARRAIRPVPELPPDVSS